MTRAALLTQAICGNVVEKQGDAGYCLAARRATYCPYRPLLDGPFRQAKNGSSQMRRPGQGQVEEEDQSLKLALEQP